MSIVKYKNQSGVTYAYEQTSNWDPIKKQSRPKRKCLGRVDPETGEIIPSNGKRGRPRKEDKTTPASAMKSGMPDFRILYEDALRCLDEKDRELLQARQEADRLREALGQKEKLLAMIHEATDKSGKAPRTLA